MALKNFDLFGPNLEVSKTNTNSSLGETTPCINGTKDADVEPMSPQSLEYSVNDMTNNENIELFNILQAMHNQG